MIVATGVFAAMHEFVPGTFETCRLALAMSVDGGQTGSRWPTVNRRD
jgi:hypothetical protein